MTSTPLASRQQLGHYEVIHLLGKGAMGSVYLARDQRIGRRVALKVIHLSPKAFEDATGANDFYRRLQREAEVCGSLLHPNIVALYEVGYQGERVSYLAMEYVEGETLLDLQRRSLPALTHDVVLRIAADVLRGLEYAHGKGIIHRDIKPANILISIDGVSKIADFGIARPLESSMTRAGSLMGTPNYMSPEQVLGDEMTPKADLFSVGVMLHELLTGNKPFAASDLTTTLNNVVYQPAPPIPGAIGDFVAALLAKTPENRPTASEALACVSSLQATATPPRLSRANDRSRLKWWVMAAVALLLIAALAIINQPRSPATVAVDPMQPVAAKRRALAEAQSLFDQGRYKESAQAYEAYLKKYPQSTVAQEGRDRARGADLRVSAPAQTRRRRPKRDEDISPREMLKRIKKAIRGK
ncbi:MAG: protein kinase [Acidobacteriota bacterium]|nr:protein kinase [Acidobacteriota bacterium]